MSRSMTSVQKQQIQTKYMIKNTFITVDGHEIVCIVHGYYSSSMFKRHLVKAIKQFLKSGLQQDRIIVKNKFFLISKMGPKLVIWWGVNSILDLNKIHDEKSKQKSKEKSKSNQVNNLDKVMKNLKLS